MKSKLLQNTKAGIYLRLSNDDERSGESLSIENQRRILEKYVAEQGFELVDTYIDDGVSGTHFNRPGVQRLLDDAKMGRVNVIIVKELSRFGRNYIEVGQYVDYIFPMYNIRFIALGDNVDTANSESSGMDMMPIMNVFNEWHAANTSKKIRAVIESNAKAGKYRTCYAPYGYVKGTDEKKLPVRDEPAASNVLRMFQMRSEGISPNKIAETFNDEHIPIPSDYKEQKFGIPNTRRSHHLWSCSTVKQIITNPIYLGNLVQMRTTTVSYKNKKTVKRDPEDICVNLLNRYVEEKNKLKAELSEIEKRQAEANKDKADVDEFIRRLKAYMKVPELTREMCMELIEFVTVDKCPGKYSKAPREIHIYYKLIDKQPIPEKKYT